MSDQQWEYTVQSFPGSDATHIQAALKAFLDSDPGWELVSVNLPFHYFKRAIQPGKNPDGRNLDWERKMESSNPKK